MKTFLRRSPTSLLLYAIFSSVVLESHGWIPRLLLGQNRIDRSRLSSTPFELDFYDNENDAMESPLACSPDTRLVLGINKYSHDTSICAADLETGQVLFSISKERLSRKKHDAGNILTLVESCLDSLDLDLDSVEKVVMNNHHHRILPLEANQPHMVWESGLGINGGVEEGYEEDENLLPDADKMEISHHLAHCYSVAAQAPFDSGLVCVMDGMGESYRTMLKGARSNDSSYISDLSFGENFFQCIPSDLEEQSKTSYFDWREAESVYTFQKDGTSIKVKPVFKRFIPEKSPPSLYNHGFENMESVGALYSRVSSHIFGDWNACGKVMGLAPWMESTWTKDEQQLEPTKLENPIMFGKLHTEEAGEQFQTDITDVQGVPHISRYDGDMFDSAGNLVRKGRYDFDDDSDGSDEISKKPKSPKEKRLPTQVALDAIALANRVQVDLETVVMDFVKHFKEETKESNLCVVGGVGLNSVMNGRLSRELGFEETYFSPYPGDDGISVGCCAFGLFGNSLLDDDDGDAGSKSSDESTTTTTPMWKEPLSPYLGPMYTEQDIKLALDEADPWLEVELIRDEDTRIEMVAQEIASGGVVAMYQGRSEMGPRALGHRSILADPRRKGLVRFINQHVKSRESFRPFAPSALADQVSDWFDLEGLNQQHTNFSPYMSVTAMVKEEKRKLIPAVTHVDGSSRLQTVEQESEPQYYKLIEKFFEITGVPMVLNTSFNTIPSEPIVETPTDAIRSFLCSMGSIEFLVLGEYVVRRKKPNLKALLGEADKTSSYMLTTPACPKRTGTATFQTNFDLEDEGGEMGEVSTKTKVRMPSRPMHHSKNEWFEVMDELEGELLSVCDGRNTMNDILAQYTMEDAEATTTTTSSTPDKSQKIEETQILVQNIVHRLVRLYEHGLISW